MNAREHAQVASYVAEESQASYDNNLPSVAAAQARVAQAHALTSIALSLVDAPVLVPGTDHGLLDELTGQGRR